MALVLADRVRDTTTTTGTGTVTLSGTAPTGYQTFATAIGNANTTYYTINAGFQWEVGIGTFTTSGNTLTRTTVLSSSSAGALVDFAVGTKDVFVTYPAEKAVNYDASNNVGIGTTSPAAKVDIVGTTRSTALVVTDAGASTTTTQLTNWNSEFKLNTVNGSSTASGAVQATLGLYYLGSTLNGGIQFPRGGDGTVGWLNFLTSGTEKMRLDASGNLGLNAVPVAGYGNSIQLKQVGASATSALLHQSVGTNVQNLELLNNALPPAGGYTAGYNYTTTGEAATKYLSQAGNHIWFNAPTGTAGAAVTFSERMRIDTTGNVGIGTSAPGVRLDVDGATRVRSSFFVYGTGDRLNVLPGATASGVTVLSTDNANTAYAPLVFDCNRAVFNVDGTERMRVASGGNVGIGTNAPSYALDVSATGNISGQFKTSGSINALYLADAGTTAGTLYVGTVGNDFRVVTGSNEHVRVTSAGLVGIGTSAPGAKLEVSSTSAGATVEVLRLNNPGGGANTAAQIKFFAAGTGYATITGGYGAAAPQMTFNLPAGAGNYVWQNASTEQMRITSAGLVGIGTSAPVGPLNVVATDTSNTIGSATASINITNYDAAVFGRTANLNFTVADGNITTRRLATISAVYTGFSGGSTAGALAFATQFNGSLSERMRIVEAGNVGIGTSAPAYQLQLSTDSAAKPSTNTWTIASDSRIKTETGEYTKGLDAVCALRPITYHYNGVAGFVDDGKENISIIAQEAMQHFPECVGTFEALLNEGDEEKTELFNWNGHALTFALVNAVKELKAVNDALTARVAQLEGK